MSKKIDWEEEFEFEEAKSDNKDFQRFIGRILANWYWFVACAVIGLAGAFIYLRYTIPVYKISAKLIVEDDKKGGGMLGASALGELSGMMGAKNSVDNEVEILRTTDLMHNMVLQEQAYIGYFKKGNIHDVPALEAPFRLVLLSDPNDISEAFKLTLKSNKDQLQLSNSDTSFNVVYNKAFTLPEVGSLQLERNPLFSADRQEEYGFTIAPVSKVVTGLMKSFSAEVTNKLVSTIDLSLDNTVPKRGQQLLSGIIQVYIRQNLHDKNVVADSTLSFINGRLEKIKDELAGVEDKISGYKQSTKLADISQQSRLLLESSADYTKSLAEVETQLAMLDGLSSYLKDSQNPRVVPSAVIPNDLSFNALVGKYNELVLQRERLLMANTEANPVVENVTSQIAGLRNDMIANLASARRNMELVRANESKLSNTINTQIQQVPTIERGYIDLARLQQIKQAQYIFLQEKWEETAIGRTANVSNAKIIDSPKASTEPISPKRKMIYALGLILGLAIPFAVIYIKDLLNVRVRGIDDVKRLSNLPILGTVSRVAEDKGAVVVSKSSRSPISEQFRAMRTNLEFSLNGGKTILMTSSMSKEGKSFVALNLAMTLSLLDKKVLLMELDLRKPSLTTKLGMDSHIGFSQYIVRPEMAIEEILIPTNVHEGVDMIQAGAIPPNPAELLIHPRAAALMEELKQRYDYIIIDAPPVGLVTDAQLLSRYADVCLYLVRQDYTYKEQLQIPNELMRRKQIANIELVVNDVHAKSGYYGNYGYGYGYGDYGQEVKPKSSLFSYFNKFKK